jgi:methyl-accepting chemotaxis protein
MVGAVGLLIVVSCAACGGGGSSTTTNNERAAQDWADDLCTATNTYITSLTSLGDTLKGGSITKDSLNQSLDTAQSATQTFNDDVKALGSPPASDSKTKNTLEDLQRELSKDADTIKNAMSNVSNATEVLSAVSTITGTLATIGTQISTAYNDIKKADPKGTIQSAFKNAPACASLTGS